ncbi:MAG TPA: HRDC domain-containing protein, partial [Edaphobacter sp.]|nr:HRDC domain-containing protein [Edaphobacter sp.]
NVSGIGPDKADLYGAAICALCDDRAVPSEYGEATPAPPASIKPKSPSRLSPAVARTESSTTKPVEQFHRQRPTDSKPTEALTPAQQALDQRLHEWRKTESEKLGVPQFFVLASSTLRSIVLAQPQTLSQLKAINGFNLEKLERFGPAIVEACTS